MTTPNTHAAPWTLRRIVRMFTGDPIGARRRIERESRRPLYLTGREAVARALYFEAVQGSELDMLNYDNSHYLRRCWLAEADRRIAGANVTIPDLLVLRWWGYTPAEWNALPALVQVDRREGYAQAKGLGK